MTSLLVAVISGHNNIARLLLERGADTGPRSQREQPQHVTALHEACKAGSAELAQLLIQHGAPLEAADSSGATPLMCAARQTTPAHSAVVRLLLAAGASHAARNSFGRTALFMACQEGGAAACASAAALLDAGAVVDHWMMSAAPPCRQLLTRAMAQWCACCWTEAPLQTSQTSLRPRRSGMPPLGGTWTAAASCWRRAQTRLCQTSTSSAPSTWPGLEVSNRSCSCCSRLLPRRAHQLLGQTRQGSAAALQAAGLP
ncbi:hypothetical protein ABPG75_002310 [Micractinium tetrahymenae]